MTQAIRDENHVTVALGVSSTDDTVTLPLKIDPATGRLLVDAAAGGYTNLTQFVDQTAWRIFYSNTDGDVVEFAFGAVGTVLTSGGASAVPTWSSAGSGDVTAAANLGDNLLIRGNGAGKGVQNSGITIDDSNNVTGMANLTATGALLSGLTASEIVITDGSKNLVSAAVATYPSLAELAYVKGVTSAIQTQMNLKSPLASPTFTGTVNAATITATGVITGLTLEATGDTAAGDNAAIGYTATEGLIVTGQGSTNDITIKNDADAAVLSIPTGTTNIAVAGNIELGHATDTTLARLAAGEMSIEGIRVLTTTPKLVSAASYTTNTGTSLNMDNCDQFIITAQAGALLFNAPGGTLVQGRSLIIRIEDNGTARALTWNAIFRAMGTDLPSTTVLGKTLYLGFFYNTTDTKWDLVASAQEA